MAKATRTRGCPIIIPSLASRVIQERVTMTIPQDHVSLWVPSHLLCCCSPLTIIDVQEPRKLMAVRSRTRAMPSLFYGWLLCSPQFYSSSFWHTMSNIAAIWSGKCLEGEDGGWVQTLSEGSLDLDLGQQHISCWLGNASWEENRDERRGWFICDVVVVVGCGLFVHEFQR